MEERENMAMELKEVADQLRQIDGKVAAAVQAVDADGSASAALQAVVKEFERKSKKAVADIDEASEPIREHIVELEQAGDSAKRAAEAQEQLGQNARRAILEAHGQVCALKSRTET